jgi:hypothetical protein
MIAPTGQAMTFKSYHQLGRPIGSHHDLQTAILQSRGPALGGERRQRATLWR